MFGVAILLGLSVSTAAADPVRIAQAFPPMLPAHEIVGYVRGAGFRPISPAMLRGDTYVLRAIGPDGREVRVVVLARTGDIVSTAPVVAAAPVGERLGPYERMDGPGYVSAAPPPIMHENDRPLRRPLAAVPTAPRPEVQDNPIYAEPPAAMRDDRMPREERGEHGLLPPPPERFPQRVAPQPPAQRPAAKPAPVKRAAASPPLPKPKPAEIAGETSGAVTSAPPAAAAPVAAPPAAPKVDARSLPH
jgi:hypothetical protein